MMNKLIHFFNKAHDTKPSTVKKRQQMVMLGILIGFILVLLLISSFGHDSRSKVKKENETETVTVASPLSHVDVQSVWQENGEVKLKKQEQEIGVLRQQLQLIQQGKKDEDVAQQKEAQQVQALQAKLNNAEGQNNNGTANGNNGFPPPPGRQNEQNNQNNQMGQMQDTGISSLTLALTPQKTSYEALMDINKKTPDTYVPAGSYATAIILEGADAAASVTSQGNPSPMLLRIIDNGDLPNHQHSHLKDCTVTAAGTGDISSERGEIRLERLSCTQPDGRIIDIPVEGNIAGPDGKNGVRGTPVWREGALLERAFAAGTLSGLSNGISQSYTTSSLTPWGTTQTVDNGKIFQYGLASGVGNAAEKLADYNIQRAEQYHPIIQLTNGTTVTIAFLKGFYLDGKKHSDDDQIIPDAFANNPSASSNVNALSAPPYNPTNSGNASLPLTPEQINTLQQKNNQLGFSN